MKMESKKNIHVHHDKCLPSNSPTTNMFLNNIKVVVVELGEVDPVREE